jgi:hypothetical protein
VTFRRQTFHPLRSVRRIYFPVPGPARSESGDQERCRFLCDSDGRVNHVGTDPFLQSTACQMASIHLSSEVRTAVGRIGGMKDRFPERGWLVRAGACFHVLILVQLGLFCRMYYFLESFPQADQSFWFATLTTPRFAPRSLTKLTADAKRAPSDDGRIYLTVSRDTCHISEIIPHPKWPLGLYDARSLQDHTTTATRRSWRKSWRLGFVFNEIRVDVGV